MTRYKFRGKNYVDTQRWRSQKNTQPPHSKLHEENILTSEKSYDKQALKETARKLTALYGKFQILKYAGLHFLLVKSRESGKLECLGEIKEWDGKPHDHVPDDFFERGNVYCAAQDQTGDRYYLLQDIVQYRACHEIIDKFDMLYFKLKYLPAPIQSDVLDFAVRGMGNRKELVVEQMVDIEKFGAWVCRVDHGKKEFSLLGGIVGDYFPRIDMPDELLPQEGRFGVAQSGSSFKGKNFAMIETVHHFLSFLALREKILKEKGATSFFYYLLEPPKYPEAADIEEKIAAWMKRDIPLYHRLHGYRFIASSQKEMLDTYQETDGLQPAKGVYGFYMESMQTYVFEVNHQGKSFKVLGKQEERFGSLSDVEPGQYADVSRGKIGIALADDGKTFYMLRTRAEHENFLRNVKSAEDCEYFALRRCSEGVQGAIGNLAVNDHMSKFYGYGYSIAE